MSRRIRCPYCDSLDTAETFSYTRDGADPQFGYVCDKCDMSWSGETERRAIKAKRIQRGELP